MIANRTTKTVSLALPTPLYAPIYLAKMQGLGGFQHVELRYADPVEIVEESRDRESGARRSHFHDPMLDQVLVRAGDHSQCILAVGDPLRLVGYKVKPEFDRPYVLAGIVQKMCYWLLDADNHLEAGETFEVFRRLIVHPKGMTGYSLIYHDMCENQKIEHNAAKRLLYEVANPGDEPWYYEKWMKWGWPLESRGARRPLAYLTTDPRHSLRGITHKHGHQVVKSYLEQQQYSDLVMTALITGQRQFDDPKTRGLIESIQEGIAEAVQQIKLDPHLCSCLLSSYSDSHMAFNRWKLGEIRDCLHEFVKYDVYRGDQSITRDQLERSIGIRRSVDKFSNDNWTGIKIDEVDSYFKLAAPLAVEDAHRDSLSEQVYHMFAHLRDKELPRSRRERRMSGPIFRSALAFVCLSSAGVLLSPRLVDLFKTLGPNPPSKLRQWTDLPRESLYVSLALIGASIVALLVDYLAIIRQRAGVVHILVVGLLFSMSILLPLLLFFDSTAGIGNILAVVIGLGLFLLNFLTGENEQGAAPKPSLGRRIKKLWRHLMRYRTLWLDRPGV